MRPFRVLALVPDAFGSHGGISKFNRDLLTAVCAHSQCVEVVAVPRLMPEPPGPLPDKLIWRSEGTGGKLRFLAAVLKTACGQLRSAVRTPPTLHAEHPTGFDWILCGHINLLPAAYLARRFIRGGSRRSRRLLCPPIALFIHGIDVWQPHRSVLVRLLLGRLDAFVSVSDVTQQRFVQWSRVSAAKGLLLPNCVDLAGFSPGEKDPQLLKKHGLAGRKVLMTLGRLLRQRPKGIDEVMEALPRLAEEVPAVSYLIVGDGPDRARLEAKAAQLGVRDRVVFAGRVSESEKAAYYRLADGFAMPGYGEGFGIVYLEALACGVPALASTLDASREALLDGEMGLLVNPRNREELHHGLVRLLQQPRGRVPPELERFSYPNFVRRCHAIVDRLCPGGEGAADGAGDGA
jgi:glycosyltransferase involved in cell wall biosynthesis